MEIPYEVGSMSDQSTLIRASVFASRLVADLGSLLPALSVLAIVVGAFWFVVNLTISPVKDDVEELKGLKLGSRLARIETTLDSINGRLQAMEAKQVELIETTARLDGRVGSLESVVRGSLIVNKPLRDPAGNGNEDTARPG